MNRFTAAGIAAAAQRGESILVLTADAPAATEAFDAVRPLLPDATATRAASGCRIELRNAATIRFRTHRQHHPDSADVIYLDHGVPEQDLDALTPIIATSPIGEIIIG